MSKLFSLLIVAILTASCGNNSKLSHKNLMGFKISYVAELGEEKYFEFEKELGKLEIKYLKDIIYVSYLKELNACGEYGGDIKILNDTIKLEVELISDLMCTSTNIDRVTFIIDNNEQKKKIIIQE